MSETKFRQEVGRRLGGYPMTDLLWAKVEEREDLRVRLYGDYDWENHEPDDGDYQYVANQLSAYEAYHRQRSTPKVSRPRPPRGYREPGQDDVLSDPHSHARSALIARAVEESDDPYLQRFRDGYLPDGLLSVEDAAQWIEDLSGQALRAGPPDPGTDRVLWFESVDREPVWVPVPEYGSLGELLRLSRWLSALWPWALASAATFVLTGRYPLVKDFDAKLEFGSFSAQPGAWRVVLTISPDMSPAELEKRYKQARAELFPLAEVTQSNKLTAKRALLAYTWAQWARWRDRPDWDALRQLWNEYCDVVSGFETGWKYEDRNASNFRSHVGDARDRILWPPSVEPRPRYDQHTPDTD